MNKETWLADILVACQGSTCKGDSLPFLDGLNPRIRRPELIACLDQLSIGVPYAPNEFKRCNHSPKSRSLPCKQDGKLVFLPPSESFLAFGSCVDVDTAKERNCELCFTHISDCDECFLRLS